VDITAVSQAPVVPAVQVVCSTSAVSQDRATEIFLHQLSAAEPSPRRQEEMVAQVVQEAPVEQVDQEVEEMVRAVRAAQAVLLVQSMPAALSDSIHSRRFSSLILRRMKM
jgi:KaiC/GvpD/RAD55 family RecA-like ATPase